MTGFDVSAARAQNDEHLIWGDIRRAATHLDGQVRVHYDGRLVSGTSADQALRDYDHALDEIERLREQMVGWMNRYEQMTDLARELQARLDAVLALHTVTGSEVIAYPYCNHCKESWPCPTVRAAASSPVSTTEGQQR